MMQQPDPHYRDLTDPLVNDSTFWERAKAFREKDEADFQAWLAKDDFTSLIDGALIAAKTALAISAGLPELVNCAWAMAEIDLANPRSKPLVQALASRGIGHAEIRSYTYEIDFKDVMGGRLRYRRPKVSSAQVAAAIEAFALAVSVPGFELALWLERYDADEPEAA